ERSAWADQHVPPAGLAGHGMDARGVLVARQRVTEENRVALGLVQSAIGLIGDRERRDHAPAVGDKRLVGGKMNALAVRRRAIARADRVWRGGAGRRRREAQTNSSRSAYRTVRSPTSGRSAGLSSSEGR